MLALLDRYGKLPEELVKIFVAEIAIAIGKIIIIVFVLERSNFIYILK